MDANIPALATFHAKWKSRGVSYTRNVLRRILNIKYITRVHRVFRKNVSTNTHRLTLLFEQIGILLRLCGQSLKNRPDFKGIHKKSWWSCSEEAFELAIPYRGVHSHDFATTAQSGCLIMVRSCSMKRVTWFMSMPENNWVGFFRPWPDLGRNGVAHLWQI